MHYNNLKNNAKNINKLMGKIGLIKNLNKN